MSIDWAAICTEALGDFTAVQLPPNMKLPSLPAAVTQFAEKSGRPDADPKKLAKIVETDSGLTLELLKHVNSAFVGARSKVTSVEQALALLGIRQSRNLLITSGMKAAVRSRESKLINQNCFWNGTFQKALFAREVALLLKTDGDLAFSGALLQDYLLPVLTNDICDEYLKFIEARNKVALNLCEYEQGAFGWDHAMAGACIAHRWKLPPELVCCILYHHAGLSILANPQLGRSPVAAVAISGLLPDQLRQSGQGLEQLLMLEKKWPAFQLAVVAAAVDKKQAESGMGVRNDFPLSRRCQSIQSIATNNNDGMLNCAA
jgi:HD-like signal output (HDOD) protein